MEVAVVTGCYTVYLLASSAVNLLASCVRSGGWELEGHEKGETL